MNFPDLLNHGWGLLIVALFFGGSIFVHELGHFLAAKWRGLHIERFSIGFGPKIFSWTRGGVEYRLSWLPLGGYVALPQLADMRGIEGDSSIDAGAMPPIGYRDKVIVAVAGAVFNIIFAFLLATILFFTGRPTSEDRASVEVGYLSDTLLNAAGQEVTAPAKAAGMQVGDLIRYIDGSPVKNWDDIHQGIALSTGTTTQGSREIEFIVERDGEQVTLQVQPIISEGMKLRQVGLRPGFTVKVGAVFPDSPIEKAGIAPGDTLLELDGQPVRSIAFYTDYLKDKGVQPVSITFEHEGTVKTAQITPEEVIVSTDGRKAVLTGIAAFDTNRSLLYQTPTEQLKEVAITTYTNLRALLHKNSDIGISHMSGPVGIIRVIKSAAQYDMLNTLWIVIFINVSLAFFNMMPIPVLDGGHIAFATINKLRRKPINPNVIASLQGSFMILLFGMMMYVTFFDVSRWISDASESAETRAKAVTPVFGNPENANADTPSSTEE
ncbi:RIP metalloprotease RseP [Pelagicoccus sp. SDUM812002]|uniref:RIP metalloprotease RseP n=1 Tax=Pelagicoccus sp. SDUM812002 TaxID=3041266 RepID=UPI00280DAD15|nr:RIP metalloprotease RseP [Pelagicoccus sp. SDUM812002]MDQ8184846.1 RIP metalloprotease RseP [Pelagicoccus sp. SDUM812002]